MTLFRIFLSACTLSAAALALPLAAQVPCDSLNGISFTQMDNGGYQHTFTPHAMDAGSGLLYTEWAFLGEGYMDHSFGIQPQATFPGAGTYLVCLRAGLYNGQTGDCEAVHCELVPIPVDPACADVVAAFSIAVEGGGIRFQDQSTAGASIYSHAWDFGDGSTSMEDSPLHAFGASGPFQVCLTVATATCSATACNWVYFGTPDVPCGTLLHPAISVIQYQQTIAAYDQSITSGMNTSRTWDFGDGDTATGNPVLHTYAWEGTYQVCGQVKLWGPLTPDTCQASACQWVNTFVAAGLGTDAPPLALHAWPLPFSGMLNVENAGAETPWQLVDLLGRVCRTGISATSGAITISGQGLGQGAYVLRLEGKNGPRTLKVVKGP